MFKTTGKLIYDPKASEATRKGEMSWWVMLNVSPSITGYYAYWLKRELGRHVNFPLWGAHVSVIRGETPTRKTLWRAHAGRRFEFEYDPNVQWNDKYAWLKVYSPDLEKVRMELGLAPRPRVPFHITVGNFKNITPPRVNGSPAVTVFPWERPELVAPNCQPFGK